MKPSLSPTQPRGRVRFDCERLIGPLFASLLELVTQRASLTAFPQIPLRSDPTIVGYRCPRSPFSSSTKQPLDFARCRLQLYGRVLSNSEGVLQRCQRRSASKLSDNNLGGLGGEGGFSFLDNDLYELS